MRRTHAETQDFITATGHSRVSVDADAAVTKITCHVLGVHCLNLRYER
ncbi:MAG: hypothetical protein MJ014_06170 [Methanocorpusculum sp.]|nr:hypothetical protein [Methanocorpusculum sp.]